MIPGHYFSKRIIHFLKTGLILFLLFKGPTLFSQTDELPENENATDLFNLGKKYLKTENFRDAGMTFEVALGNPLNRVTTGCIFYSGLCWYKTKDYERAKPFFNRLIQNYPLSNYADEARYYKALILMESNDNSYRELGLDLLLLLSKNSNDASLRKNALDASRHYLFEVLNRKFVEVYFQFSADELKEIVMEAICYHLEKEGKGDQIPKRLEKFLEEGGHTTRYLTYIKRKNSGKGQNPATVSNHTINELRIVIVLPFNLNYVTAAGIPPESQRGLELYEGMKMALDSISVNYSRPIRLKVIDSKNDTLNVRNSLEEIGEFSPDILIGDISTKTSRILANWAEENGVIQFVPLNPSTDLIKNKKNIFLTHPSIPTHGSVMASYAYKNLSCRKVVILTDGTQIVKEMESAFQDKFKSLGGMVTFKSVPSKFEPNDKTVEEVISWLKGITFDAVYIPLANEEIAGLIAAKMRAISINTRILGSPDWENFNAIDNDLKQSMKLTWSTFFYENNDSLALKDLQEQTLDTYGSFPVKFMTQGYDIMHYVLECLQQIEPGETIQETIHKQKNIRTIHQDFQFGEKQDNQRVTIVQFINGRVVKIN